MALNSKKGSVLVFVLIFIAFAASTVLLIHEHSMKSFQDASEDFYDNQANIYAMTAVTAVAKALSQDDNAYDSPREDWAMIPLTEVPYGYISVKVEPVNAKISLNGMTDPDHKISARYLNACENIAAEQETDSLKCAEVKDYADSDSDVSYGGAEGVTYDRNGVHFRTKNAPLSTLYELRLLMNNNEEFSKVKDYLTVFNPQKAININFASALTIRSFLPELADYADDIVNYRKTRDFKDPSNIKEAASIPQDVYLAVIPFITVKSTLFYVKTEVTLNDKPRYYHAVIKKDGTQAEVVNFLAGLNGQYY